MHQYAAGRPDEKDIKTLAAFSKQIIEKPDSSDMKKPNIPGNRPYKKFGGAGLTPKADKNCVGCGVCVNECPVEAIDKSNVGKTDKNKCISCMRCVVRCQHGARKVSGALVMDVKTLFDA